MKIGLISRGRTYSSAIIASLAQQYNLKNLNESYFSLFPTVDEIKNLKLKLLKKEQQSFDIFKKSIISFTQKLFLNENFVIKLWPSMLTYLEFNVNDYTNEVIFDKIKENIIFNITDCWKIKDYDNFYYLDRNLNNSLYSWVWSKKTKYFQNYKKIIPVNTIIELNDDDIRLSKEYILEYCLQQKIKDFLIKNNLKYTYICDDYNLYINDSVLKIQPTNNNYKNLIQNTEKLDKLLQEWYPICLDYTKDWQFH